MRGEPLQQFAFLLVLYGGATEISTAVARGVDGGGALGLLLGLVIGAIGTLLALDGDAWLRRKANQRPFEG